MTKPSHRRFEHVQKEKPKAEPSPEKPAVATGFTARRDEPPAAEEPEAPRPDPVMAHKYWLAIILWAIAFGLMIFYEVIGAIVRR
jgi:hypothetical protein